MFTSAVSCNPSLYEWGGTRTICFYITRVQRPSVTVEGPKNFTSQQLLNIQLQQPFEFAGQIYPKIQVNNIFIKFIANGSYHGDYISPLEAPVESTSGNLTYEQDSSGPLIDQANQEIKRMFPKVSFSASWVFVLTWRNVMLYKNTGVASCQLVLASDAGRHYFVLMNYGNIPFFNTSIFWSARYHIVDKAFTIRLNDSSELTSTSNVNITGRWAFHLTDNTTATPVTSCRYRTDYRRVRLLCACVTSCQTLNYASDEVCGQINGVDGCAGGYNTTSSPNIYDAIETCSGSTGSLSLSRCQLFEAGYSADVLHLNDPSCKGKVQNNRLVFNFDSNASLCGTTLENNGTHVIFKNNVGTTNMTGLISHTGGFNIAISCVYPLIQNISMPTHIEATGRCPKPSDGSVSVFQNGVSTSSRFSFSMFTFANFSPKIYLHCQVHLCLQKTGNCTLAPPSYPEMLSDKRSPVRLVATELNCLLSGLLDSLPATAEAFTQNEPDTNGFPEVINLIGSPSSYYSPDHSPTPPVPPAAQTSPTSPPSPYLADD
ncbi:hypothetical protein KOW79_011719 [Hemibagrus wyckioides]|uniref:ZP domain-containing protein n=1 Tax=Hemibagrus wyckioides TaxID=337641 RepID=A0A9D3NM07_9TELE|nr:hypothetical protein KOW79_011719 [Hemibagrus wyckioides]